jgi:hypothetical protein
MVEAGDPFRGVCRIGRDRFRALLARRAAPAVLAERDAGEYWDAIRAFDLDPLFIAAIFWHESQMGRQGVATQTRSWGNTRHPTFGGVAVVGQVGGASGTFPAFASWRDGCVSTCARLVEPRWYYATRTSIGEIFAHPSGLVWAPAGDQNDPAGYLASVLAFMTEHADPDTEGVAWMDDELAVRVAHLPVGNANRPGGRYPVQYITIHETANPAPGANAEAHRRYVWSGGGPERTSYHYVVDAHEAIELLPPGEAAYHAGTATGNTSGIAIELCVNADGNWAATLARAARLVAHLCWEWGVPVERVVQHHHWSGKDCPARLRRAGWAAFLAEVEHLLTEWGLTPPDNRVRLFAETGRYLGHGFLAFWEALGEETARRVLGLPLTNEQVEGGLTVQWFERACLEYHPDAPPGWTVQLRRLGALELARRGAAGADG